MIKLRVLKDGFCIGMHTYNKGDIVQVLPPSVAYAVSTGSCEIASDAPKPVEAPKKKTKKKATYKTKVVEAE